MDDDDYKALLAIALMVGLAASALRADDRALARGEWRYYSGADGARKYSPPDQIRRDNVAQLRIAWRRPHLDASLTGGSPPRLSNNFRSTSLMVNGVMAAISVQSRGADSRRPRGRGPAHQGRHPDHQAVVGLRPRPGDRQTGVADRRAAGAGLDGARRTGVADATPPPRGRLPSIGKALPRTT